MSREQTAARRATSRHLHEVILKDRTARGQLVQVRRYHEIFAITGQLRTQVVHAEKQDIGTFLGPGSQHR